MTELKGKIDFTAFIAATNANPNGDPLNGNRPRTDLDGYGEMSDVCIKRKIRNRFPNIDISSKELQLLDNYGFQTKFNDSLDIFNK